MVFGRGDNPINFVSVIDVAAVVDRVIAHRATWGVILEIGGIDNLTLNELARAVQTAAGRPKSPRPLPPAMLRVMAGTVGRVKPELGRQARAALAMDRVDLRFDAAPIHRIFPDIPSTSLTDLLGGGIRGSETPPAASSGVTHRLDS